MPTPFDKLTIPQIQQALRAAVPADYAPNLKFYNGDHWQDGAGWVGPQPQVTDPMAAQVICEIQRAFVAQNVVKETTGRHSGGVIGREPIWGLTVRRPLKQGKQPTKAEQALIDEAEALLTEWWDERGIHALVQKAIITLLLGQRAVMRLFVPPGLLKDGRVPQSDLRSALFSIYADRPAIDQAMILTDTATLQQAGVYVFSASEQPIAELATTGQGETRLELTAIEDGKTVLRIIRADGTVFASADPLDLGGHILMHELQRPLLISEPVRRLQKLLNLALTMESRNVVQGGFLERTILNGQMPGSWVDDSSAPDGKRFVPDPTFRVGAGKTNFIAGLEIIDTQGEVTDYTTPSMVYRDPIKIDTFEGTADGAYSRILRETHQLHALISGDATATGESRAQARAEFEQDLLETKAPLDRAVRWMLETALALAAQFSGQPGRFATLRATCECRIDTGPISADEMRVTQEMTGGEPLLSPETGMARIRVEDVGAEQARIAAARAVRQAEATPTQSITPNDQRPTTDDQPPSPDKDPA